MTGMSREEEHSCKPKKAWPSKARAKLSISKMNRELDIGDELEFSSYKCTFCGLYHVGKRRKQTAEIVERDWQWSNQKARAKGKRKRK